MEHLSNFPRQTVEHPDIGITLPDGCRLSARLWLPEDAQENPVPVILEYLPYRKRDGTIVRDEYTHPWFAGHGYACLRVDMRGNGESEGLMHDEYLEEELEDACEVIAWAASQKWSNGNVGMMGISWGGFNALQVAALQPPALNAIITICSSADRYADDIHYKGGCMMGENFGWSANMLSYSSRPPDPLLVGEDKWLSMWKHRLENIPYNWKEWFEHQHRDAYWKHGSICEDFSSIKAAVLSIGGWHDGYRNTISNLVCNLSSPVKGIVGPWNHKYPHYAGPKPAIGFLQEAKRWWDKWLKGHETGVENDPAYRAYLMDSIKPKRWFDKRPGKWIEEENWPSPNIKESHFYLSDNKLLTEPENSTTIISSPQDCGIGAGEYFPFAFSDELPDEQSHDDTKSTCFVSAELEESISIVGAPKFKCKIKSDKPNAQICVRLCDLRPDGTSALITFGVLNITHHTSHETPTALGHNEEVSIEIVLDQIAYKVPKGHRLSVAISNAYWPTVWPSPEATILQMSAASIAIGVRPESEIEGDEWHFEKPQAAPAWQHKEIRPASYSRNVTTKDGKTILTIDCDNGENEDLTHGLVSGSWTKEIWEIDPDDPNSATTQIDWEQSGGREGTLWKTHAECKMWSDAQYFYSTAKLICFLNGEHYFEKQFEEKTARNLV